MPSDLSFEDHARIKSRQHRGEKQNEQRSEDRNDATGNRRSWSTLFEVYPDHPNVHEPEDFGYLVFVD